MTAQTAPNVGAQPKAAQGGAPTGHTPTPTRKPTPTRRRPTAQPTPTAHQAEAAHWAFRVAVTFWAVAAIVDRLGYSAEGVAGVVLGGAAMGVSIAQAAAHDWAARKVGGQ